MMNHPSLLLTESAIHRLRESSWLAEKEGKLTAAQLEVISHHRWFDLFVPHKYKGLQLTLPEAVRLEEALAWADGNVGWVTTLCAGAAWFVGYIEPGLADEIFADNFRCIAGSGQANGVAIATERGYRVSGHWPYASGAAHATWFTGNCKIQDGHQETVRSFIFRKDEVTTQANWKYIGLNGTAGYSYSVSDLDLPSNRTFLIDPHHCTLPQLVYRYPFLQLAEATLAVNTSGMCLYFLELAKPRAGNLISAALSKLKSLRNDFYEALDKSWAAVEDGGGIDEHMLQSVSSTSRQLANGSRALVNEIYPYCGLEAAKPESSISLVWRNIYTASQHSLLLNPLP